jgi:hypothetical protein
LIEKKRMPSMWISLAFLLLLSPSFHSLLTTNDIFERIQYNSSIEWTVTNTFSANSWLGSMQLQDRQTPLQCMSACSRHSQCRTFTLNVDSIVFKSNCSFYSSNPNNPDSNVNMAYMKSYFIYTRKKGLFSEICSSNDACDSEKGLICSNGFCVCNDSLK